MNQHEQRRTVKPRRLSVLNGQDLRNALLEGAAYLEERRDYINALNVFPVPDGDTGSNMSATMKSAIRHLQDSDEQAVGAVAAKLAHDALLGARGNSGVILSQTFRGLANGLANKQTCTAADLANALQEASNFAYRAVLKPVEGTILTVVKEVGAAAQQSASRGHDIVALLYEAVKAARRAVARTPEMLPQLKQAGVVDAGGQGYCTIFEGILRYLRGGLTQTGPLPTLTEQPVQKKGKVVVEEEFGYEVVFLLYGSNLDVSAIRQTIIDMGGVSTVVAGDEKMLKVHTHTLQPGRILDYGVSLGELLDINIENLQAQSLQYAAESAAEHAGDTPHEQVSIATVAVVSGDGFQKVFSGLGVHKIVSGGQTMNPSIEELLSAIDQAPSDKVIILPNNSNVVLSAKQAADLSLKEVSVIPTKTLPQGIASLIAFNHADSFADNVQTMTEASEQIQTAEITTAVRTVVMGGVQVREGDYIGVLNGHLAVADTNIQNVLHDILQRMQINLYEIVTLYYGAEITLEAAEQTAQRIKETYPSLEIEVVNGGQPYYAYILSAE